MILIGTERRDAIAVPGRWFVIASDWSNAHTRRESHRLFIYDAYAAMVIYRRRHEEGRNKRDRSRACATEDEASSSVIPRGAIGKSATNSTTARRKAGRSRISPAPKKIRRFHRLTQTPGESATNCVDLWINSSSPLRIWGALVLLQLGITQLYADVDQLAHQVPETSKLRNVRACATNRMRRNDAGARLSLRMRSQRPARPMAAGACSATAVGLAALPIARDEGSRAQLTKTGQLAENLPAPLLQCRGHLTSIGPAVGVLSVGRSRWSL